MIARERVLRVYVIFRVCVSVFDDAAAYVCYWIYCG